MTIWSGITNPSDTLRVVSGLPRYKPSSVLPAGTLDARSCSLDGSFSTMNATFAILRRKWPGILAHARSTRQSNSCAVMASCYSTEELIMAIVIAIDGPAGAGKSTIARRLAVRLGFTYIDSGAMYRAVALWALRQNIDPSDMHRMEQLARAAGITLAGDGARVLLDGEDVTESIRAPEVSKAASLAATIPGVRRALVEKQRAIGAQTNVGMKGRDIGSFW